MKTSWYIKNISNKRVQLLHLTYDDESKDLVDRYIYKYHKEELAKYFSMNN